MKATKVFKTKKDTILLVEISTDGCAGRQYVSITASEIAPIKRDDAIEQCKAQLEDGELWRMAVQAEQTEMGLEDWIENVMDIDGELSGFDNSLYDTVITIDDEEYLFESQSCGCLHDDIKELTDEFNPIIELHLSDRPKDLKKAETYIFKLQKKEDIDFWVEKYTRQILGVEGTD